MFGLKLNKIIWLIFTHLKLWVAVARHNFKWVKNLDYLILLALKEYMCLCRKSVVELKFSFTIRLSKSME